MGYRAERTVVGCYSLFLFLDKDKRWEWSGDRSDHQDISPAIALLAIQHSTLPHPLLSYTTAPAITSILQSPEMIQIALFVSSLSGWPAVVLVDKSFLHRKEPDSLMFSTAW